MGYTRARRGVMALSAAVLVCGGALLTPDASANAAARHAHRSSHVEHRAARHAVAAAKPATTAPSTSSPLGSLVGSVRGLLSIGGSTTPPSSAATASGPTAQVWITTADGSQQLAPAASASFGGTRLADDLSVDTGAVQQPFSGAGASLTESSASVIDTLGSAARTKLIDDLFSASGLHLSYLRQPLGGSDFVSHLPFYTYEDTRGTVDLSRDQADVLPLVEAAQKANPSLKILGSPWTAPAWLKTSGSLTGGTLKAGDEQKYADYLVAVAKRYAAAGAPLSDLTVQNEPGVSAGYPSMTLSVAQEVAVVRDVDADLTAAKLPTRLWVGDDSWATAGQVLSALDQLKSVSRVQGAAFHCYGGSPSDMTPTIKAGWRVYDTECSGTDSQNPANTFGDTLLWQTQNLVVSAMRSGAETVMMWNLALDGSGGPQYGSCDTRCNGVVQVQDGVVSHDAQYDVLGQLTKFVDVGAHVVSSTSGGTGGVEDVAFVNPDGSRVVLVLNDATSSQTFSITADGKSLDYALPASSVATFVWR